MLLYLGEINMLCDKSEYLFMAKQKRYKSDNDLHVSCHHNIPIYLMVIKSAGAGCNNKIVKMMILRIDLIRNMIATGVNQPTLTLFEQELSTTRRRLEQNYVGVKKRLVN